MTSFDSHKAVESFPMESLVVSQFVDEGLGNASYVLASRTTGIAAVVDPQRDVDKYVRVADGLGLKLKYALETHLHADFVTGAHELAHRLGLPHSHDRRDSSFQIGVGASAQATFEHLSLRDGDRLSLGDCSIGVLDTPGHTPEHISYAVYAENSAQPGALFSGGSLIVGGTGRPDLLGNSHTVPLARALHRTIHSVVSELPDSVVVYPTHGSGSFCNTTSTGARTTTIGHERRTNPFFQLVEEEAFVRRATTNLSSYPTYYGQCRSINRAGPRILGGVPVLPALSPDEVARQFQAGVAIVDIRPSSDTVAAHIPGAYGIPLATPLGTWAGWVIPFGTPLILVADTAEQRLEATLQLIRIGYDNLRGYLSGGIDAWCESGRPVAHWKTLHADELHSWLAAGDGPRVLDVRYASEWARSHIRGARHIEAGALPGVGPGTLPLDRPLVVHCARGLRSTVALSILERLGHSNLYALDGGLDNWVAAGYPTEQAR